MGTIGTSGLMITPSGAHRLADVGRIDGEPVASPDPTGRPSEWQPGHPARLPLWNSSANGHKPKRAGDGRIEQQLVPARALKSVTAYQRTATTLSYLEDCRMCVLKRLQ